MENQPASTSPAPGGLPDAPDAGGAQGSGLEAAGAAPDADHAAESPSSPVQSAASGRRTLSQLGDYLLLRKIGAGAMGAVYKAREVSTQREVALKVLFKHVAGNPKLLERFYREARVAGLMDHPNIVRGFGVDQDHGWHYFAMEFIDGESLQCWLRRLGKLSLGDSLHVVLACAHALQYAHQQALVHRDVKPDNILITRQGETRLADLGMVKQLDDDMSLTQTGHAVGTPWYMPLEQAKNAKETDGRCDIYALGCVFYACLTGQPPFAGPTLVEVIHAKEAGTFPPARQFNSAVTERVDLIIAKMTAKLPKYRYQNCTDLIKDLEGLGLANRSLGFLCSPQECTQPPVITDDGQRPAGVSPTEPTPFPNRPGSAELDVWYLRYKKADGTPVQSKLTTAEVLRLADSAEFDDAARASRNPREGYRALATYKEFERVVARVTRSHADKQTFRQRKLFDKIVEEQNQRQELPKGPTTTFQYWLGICWRAAAVGGLVGLLYFIAMYFINGLRGVF